MNPKGWENDTKPRYLVVNADEGVLLLDVP
jgi:hypothetical protein